MRDWFLDYHQVLRFRLFGMTMLLATLAVCSALGCGLRTGCLTLARRASRGALIWQRRTP
jgi:hypothetical protein